MLHASRREFLALAAAALLAPAGAARALRPRRRTPHPTPRPGITGARVLSRERLADTPKLVGVFDEVRALPAVMDGIRCNCGCDELPGFYSLLSCFEGDAMALHCAICQGQARLAARLHREGKTLHQIRDAVDAKFG